MTIYHTYHNMSPLRGLFATCQLAFCMQKFCIHNKQGQFQICELDYLHTRSGNSTYYPV